MKRLHVVFLAFALIAPQGYASAHTLGASFEATSSPYFIDVGYDPDPMEAGSSVRFEFELRDSKRFLVTEYDYVWVRVVRDRQTLFATGIYRQFLGPTTLLYTFEEPGSYTVDVGYRAEKGDEIAQAEFTFDVLAVQEKYDTKLVVLTILLLAGLLGVSAILYRRRGTLRTGSVSG